MATLGGSNLIIAADRQADGQMVRAGAEPRTQHTHGKERERKYQ